MPLPKYYNNTYCDRDEAIPCLCCKHCKDCTSGFEKIIDLKKAGLVIYRHKVQANQNIGNVVFATNITEESQDVFILHNTKDAHVSSADFLPEMAKTKTCSRCRKIMEHARKLLQNVPGINKNDALGICDHCRLRDQSCFDCKKITKKFFAIIEQVENHEEERKQELLRKMKKMLNSSFPDAKTDGSEVDRLLFIDHSGRRTKISVEKGGKFTFTPDDDHFNSFSNYETQMKEQRQKREVGHPSSEDFTTYREGRFMKKFGKTVEKALPMQNEKHTNEYDVEDIYPAGGYTTSKHYKQGKENYPKYERKATNECYFTGSPETGTYSRNRLKGEVGSHDERSYKPKGSYLTLFGTEAEMKRSNFSYNFPKHNEKKVRYKDQNSSSVLIKDTKDRLQTKTEEERKIIADEKQKTRLALEEKVMQAAEKKKLSGEKQKAENEGKLKKETVRSDSVKHTKDIETEKQYKKKTIKKKTEKERKGIDDKKQKKPLSLEEKAVHATEKKKLSEGKQKVEKEGKLKEESVGSKSVINRKDKEIERKHKEKINKENAKKFNELKSDVDKGGKGKGEQTQNEKTSEPLQKKLKSTKKLNKDDDKQRSSDLGLKVGEGSETKEEKIPKKKTEAKTKQAVKRKSKSISQEDFLIVQLLKKLQPKMKKDLVSTPSIIMQTKKKQIKHKPTIEGEGTSDSDIELGFECRKAKSEVLPEIIIGQKILKKKNLIEKKESQGRKVVPQLFRLNFIEFPGVEKVGEPAELLAESVETVPPKIEREGKGVLNYALSNRLYIEKGWTKLPTEKIMRRMNVYRMRPAHPEFDWFKHNKHKGEMHYDSGERLADFTANGRGRWYYKSGRLALDYYDAEELNAQQRFVIYSNGEPDERGRPRPYTVLATFDYLGNGVVFDHSGKIRLKYNQSEGVVFDRKIGPVSNWKWHALNDPPVLQPIMIDTQVSYKDPKILKMDGEHDKPPRPNHADMLAIEFDNFIKEKSKKLCQTFKPFQIKMKVLKINENFSLKVLDQANVHLIYRDGRTHLKINIGMILDHKNIVDTDTAELGDVSNELERFPARTDSLAGLQKSVACAQHFERTRTERERKLHPPKPCESTDKLHAAASRPIRPLLRAVDSGSTPTSTTKCYSKHTREPSSSNFYYNAGLCYRT